MNIKGFTLIELLFSLSVLGFLALLSTESWVYLKQKNEQQIVLDQIISAVQYAKMQAFSRGQPLFLSPLEHSSDWSNGIVLTKLNNKTQKEEVLHQWKWHYNNLRVKWAGAVNKQHIIISDSAMNAMSNGQFTITNIHTNKQTRLTLNRLGRIKIV